VIGVDFRSVRYSYPDAEPALDDVTFEVQPGQVLLLVGSSGSGKSTLLRSVNGLVPHATGGRFEGVVVVDGRSTRDALPRDLADVVGFVHQEPEAQFVVDRVEGDIAFVLENLAVDPTAMRRRVEEVLDALGIAHLRHRSPATLSGGERQRCAVAGALAAGPSVLVLDEPTSTLDPQGAEDVLGAVSRLNADLGTTVLLAEHRLERAAPIADRAVLLAGGRVLADGPPREVLAGYPGAPPVTRLGHLLGWVPPPLTVREAQTHARREPFETAWTLATNDRPAPGPTLLRTQGLAIAHGSAPVLSGVDLDIRAGETWALLGRNGSGKTTLLRALAGLHRTQRGTRQVSGSVAYVPQDPDALLFADTVRKELENTLRLTGQTDSDAIDAWLERLGLAAMAERHPRSLSVGEKQRVAVAAIAVGGADVLLLDEPTRGIDAASRAALVQAVAEHTCGGGAVVIATHDVDLAAEVAHQAIVLGDGEIVGMGEARELLSGSLFAPQVLRTMPPFLTVDEVERAMEVRR
jgi:energy-coupling factor transport system ATP-binding protein